MKLNVYIYNEEKLKYESFRVFRFRHFILLLAIIAIASFFSISIFYTFFETPREKELRYNLTQMYIDYNEVNRRNLKAEIILSKLHPSDTSIPHLDSILLCIPSITPIEKKYIKRIRPFGERIHPVYKTKDFHTGIDFSARLKIPIVSTGNGIVIFVGVKNGYGNTVMIDHGYGYKTLYGHIHSFKVKDGQEVKKGEVIGLVGNTGTSTGSHVHYEVIKEGKIVNPGHYIFGSE